MIAQVKNYLLQNKSLKIKGFGELSVVYMKAGIHPILHTFTTPGNYLQFKAGESESDVGFADYISREDRVSNFEAIRKIEDWVEELKSSVNEKGEYVLGSMGSFVKGINGIEFRPVLDPDFSPESFGFKDFDLNEEKKEDEFSGPTERAGEVEQSAKVGETVESGEVAAEEPEKNKTSVENAEFYVSNNKPKRHPWKIIFYVLLILLLSGIIAMGVYALIKPREFVEYKDKCISYITSFFGSGPVDASDVDAIEGEEGSDFENYESNLSEEDAAVSEHCAGFEEDKEEEINCYIIIGGFSKEANANKLVNNLKSRYPNIANLGMNKRGTLIMVGIGPYSKSEAENLNVAVSSEYKDSWILER